MNAQRFITRAVPILLAAGVLAACNGPDPQQEAEPGSAAVAIVAADEDAARGQALFDGVCSACHTMQPPPNLAPPMMGVISHYRDAFDSRDPAVDAMVAYIQAPDPAKSKLDPMAFDRFGTMAPLALPEEDLRAVAGWLWDSYDPELDPHRAGGMDAMGGKGPGRGQGQGAMDGRGGPGTDPNQGAMGQRRMQQHMDGRRGPPPDSGSMQRPRDPSGQGRPGRHMNRGGR